MARHLQALIDPCSILPVRLGKCRAQTVLVGWHQNDVHMIGHQAPRPYRALRLFSSDEQLVAVETVVVIVEENLRAPVAPLGDMMRLAGNDNPRQAGHGAAISGQFTNDVRTVVDI